MKIVFFGTPQFAADYLAGLMAEPGFEIVGLVTQPDEPVGRKQVLTPPPVKLLGLKAGIPVFQPTKLKDPAFQSALQALAADVFVVIAYGRLLPETLLTMAPLGCVNVHPSLLPKWRGPSPIISTLAAGDTKTGVSVMKLVKAMDAGPVLAQVALPIEQAETTATLTAKVVAQGLPTLIQALKDYAAGTLQPVEQDPDKATFCKLLSRQDGVIDWTETAADIERKIRAYTPWPGSSSGLFKIFAAQVSNHTLAPGQTNVSDGRLFVGTATAALEITELQPQGGKRMAAGDYVRGHADIRL